MDANSTKDEIELGSISSPLLSNDAEVPENIDLSTTTNIKKGNIYLKHWRDFLSVIFFCDSKDDRNAWKVFGIFAMVVISIALTISFLIRAPYYLIRHLVMNGVLDCYDKHVIGPVATSECSPDGNGGNLHDTTVSYVLKMWLFVWSAVAFLVVCIVCLCNAYERIQIKKKSLLEKQI